MEFMWFQIEFTEQDLKQGKALNLVDEIRKLHRILDYIEGLALYAGKYTAGIGQNYFLTIPDNSIGRNLLQYIKLKNYLPCTEPELNELTLKCGCLSGDVKTSLTKPELVTSFILN